MNLMPSPRLMICTVTACFFSLAMLAADWPQWRGLKRDGYSPEAIPPTLATTPVARWRKSIAHGYAAPVVVGDKLIFLDDQGGKETAHAVSATTGTDLWSVAGGEAYGDEFEPGPRCTPLVDGDRVYVQTCRGEFRCLSLSDGKTLWRFHFADFGAVWVENKQANAGAASRRGNAGAPVVVGDLIIVQIGSAEGACLGAFDKVSGKLRWKSQNDLTCYSSLVSATLAGQSHVIAATCEGLLAVKPGDGAVLWRVPFRTGANRNALTPVVVDDTVYFASHTTGMRATGVEVKDGSVAAVERWLNRDLRINLASPVAVKGHLYGLGPARNFICVDRSTGHVAWSQSGFGEVASTITDGQTLLILTDGGEVVLAPANPEAWHESGRFQACGKTFSHPALSNGVLFVRDSRELVAWPLASPKIP
jgi:outer membrane protein assembly factor BamB